jgi:hypothetical protein
MLLNFAAQNTFLKQNLQDNNLSLYEFYAYGSVHCESMLECSNKMTLLYSILFPANSQHTHM